MRLVLDTNVIVSAMRSPTGASAEILRLARFGQLTPIASVPLAIEYEDVCARPEHVRSAGLEPAAVADFVAGVVAMMEPVVIWYLWRPRLRDPGDELVLETAVNGRADAIVTFNTRDFEPEIRRFGLEAIYPRTVLERLTP